MIKLVKLSQISRKEIPVIPVSYFLESMVARNVEIVQQMKNKLLEQK